MLWPKKVETQESAEKGAQIDENVLFLTYLDADRAR